MTEGAVTLATILEAVTTVLTTMLTWMTSIVSWIFATPGVAIWVYAALILIAIAAVCGFVRGV